MSLAVAASPPTSPLVHLRSVARELLGSWTGSAGWRHGVFASVALASREPAESDERPVDLELTMARRAGDGDARAQAWLARRLMGRVRRIARALTATAAEADDAAQLSLMAILRSAGGYRGDASLEAWAKRVAVRTTLRYVQRERRLRPSVSLEELGEPASRVGVAPQHAAALSRDLRVMLESVSEAQRTALVLHHALGYSLDEIAGLTDASRNTVKSRLRLGTRALRKRIRRERSIGAGGGRGDA